VATAPYVTGWRFLCRPYCLRSSGSV